MVDPAPSNGPALRSPARSSAPPMAVLAAAVAMAALGAGYSRTDRAPAPPHPVAEAAAALAERPEIADPAPTAEADAPEPGREPWRDALGGPLSRWAWTAEPGLPAAEETAQSGEARGPEAPSVETPAAQAPRTAMIVPLPVPRPPELRRPGGPDLARRSERQLARRQPALPLPQPAAEERSFFEALFGVEKPPALAYAALERRPTDIVPRPRLSPSPAPPSASGGTAVYDITARTVTLPNGERLEAHSGLGETMDDPRNVHVRMRGATPPGTYDLTEREQAFHGVRAIRLNPVGGSAAVYGRVGLLAHTYMLGPSGASNGCVSFRDYDRFLQAYLRGEVQRLVVVSGTADPLPSLADDRTRAVTRMARNGG